MTTNESPSFLQFPVMHKLVKVAFGKEWDGNDMPKFLWDKTGIIGTECREAALKALLVGETTFKHEPTFGVNAPQNLSKTRRWMQSADGKELLFKATAGSKRVLVVDFSKPEDLPAHCKKAVLDAKVCAKEHQMTAIGKVFNVKQNHLYQLLIAGNTREDEKFHWPEVAWFSDQHPKEVGDSLPAFRYFCFSQAGMLPLTHRFVSLSFLFITTESE